MKFNRATTALAGLIVMGLASTQLLWAVPSSKEELLQSVKEAVAKKDSAAIMGLFNKENTDLRMMSMSEMMVTQIVKDPIKEVSLEPLEVNFKAAIVVGDQVYHPNIPVLGYVKFHTGGENSVSMNMPYGEKDGSYYLAGTVKEAVQ